MDLTDRQTFGIGLTYIIFRRYLMMFVIFLAVFALFVFAGYLVTPSWEAEVLLLAEQREPSVSPLGGSQVPPSTSEAAENLAQMLTGKQLTYDMVKQFGLDERTRLKAQEPPTFRDWFKVTLVEVVMSPIRFLQWIGWLPPSEVDWVDKAAEDFRDDLFFAWLDVEVMEDSQVVVLTINGETPQLATDVANAMVRRVRERLAEATARAGRETREAHGREVQRVADRLAEMQERLKVLQEDQGGGTLTDETRAKTLKLQELSATDSRLRQEIDVLARQLEEAARDPGLFVNINSESITANRVVQDLRSSLHSKEVQLASMLTERTDEHPDVVNLREEIAELRDAVGTEIANVHRGLSADQTRIQAEIAELRAELRTLPGQQQALADLTLAVETYRSLYRELLQASEEMDVLANSAVAAIDFKVLDDAYVSPLATSDMPSWLIVLVVGFAFAIATAFAVALFVEYWRDPIKGPGDLRRHQVEVLGVVPRVP